MKFNDVFLDIWLKNQTATFDDVLSKTFDVFISKYADGWVFKANSQLLTLWYRKDVIVQFAYSIKKEGIEIHSLFIIFGDLDI